MSGFIQKFIILFLSFIIFQASASDRFIGQINASQGFPQAHGHASFHKGDLVMIFANDSGVPGGGFGFLDIEFRKDKVTSRPVFVKKDNQTYPIREPHGYGYTSHPQGDLVALQAIEGIQIWNWTDHLNPKLLSYLKLPGIQASDYATGAWWLFYQAPYIYVGGSANGLYIVDASDPTKPFLVRRQNGPNPIPISQLGNYGVGPVFAIGNLMVLSGNDSAGFTTLDVSDPINPQLLATLKGPKPYSIFVTDNKILTAGADDKFHIHDISNPKQILPIGSVSMREKGGYLTYQDGIAHVGASKKYSKILIGEKNEKGLYSPKIVEEFSSKTSDRDEDFSSVFGSYALVSDDHGFGSWWFRHQDEEDVRGPEVNMVSPLPDSTNQSLLSRVGISLSDAIDFTTLKSGDFILREMATKKVVRGFYSYQMNILSFAPAEPLMPNTTYEVVLTAGGIKDVFGNSTLGFHSQFTTGTGNSSVDLLIQNPSHVQTGQRVSLKVSSSVSAEYSWKLDSNEKQTNWSRSPDMTFVYSQPGRKLVTAYARVNGQVYSKSTTVSVYNPVTSVKAQKSSPIVTSGNFVSVVNSDANTVSTFTLDRLQKLYEVSVGAHPRQLAVEGKNLWVVNQESFDITILDMASGRIVSKIALPSGSYPFGIVIDSNNKQAFVALEGKGELVAISTSNQKILKNVPLGFGPRGLVLTHDSQRLFVTRYISTDQQGELVEVNPKTYLIQKRIPLQYDTTPDREDNGRGLPNILMSAVISPDGNSLWVPSKKDNITRGQMRDGLALSFENTVRTMIARVDLRTSIEDYQDRHDFNDRDMAIAAEFSPFGDYLFVALQGSNAVDVIDPNESKFVTSLENIGLAPQGLVLSQDGKYLLVHNFMSRSLTVFDVATFFKTHNPRAIVKKAEIKSVQNETLEAQVLRGKQIFYNARDFRMSRDGYLSCASCHQEGRQDGRVWDFTDRGEGFRNTTSLVGRKGMDQGRVHWTANFDEIQDFENDIRNGFGGKGFLTDEQFAATKDPLGGTKAGLNEDLDALAAYVTSLSKKEVSPNKPITGFSDAALRGLRVFESQNCASCHSGSNMTDSLSGKLHNIGTIKRTSGKRRGEPLQGIDTPTLLGVWNSAPYLHDGSAATLMDVLMSENKSQLHGQTQRLSEQELKDLVQYLKEL